MNKAHSTLSSSFLAVLLPPQTYSHLTQIPFLIGWQRLKNKVRALSVRKQASLAKKSTDLFNVPRQFGASLALGTKLREVHTEKL